MLECLPILTSSCPSDGPDLTGGHFKKSRPPRPGPSAKIHPALAIGDERRLAGSSYERKIAAYKQIVDQRIYKSHFGIPNLLVLNVTTNATHMNNIMALVKQMVGQSRFFLFKTMSSLGDFAKAPSPTPHMLTAAWQRVGYEPFAMNK